MMQIEKRDEKKKVERKKKITITKQDSSPSTSLVSLYDIDFENDNSNDASSWNPSLMKEASSPHEQGEEMNSSQATAKIPLK